MDLAADFARNFFFIIYIQCSKFVIALQDIARLTLINLKSTSPTDTAFILPQF